MKALTKHGLEVIVAFVITFIFTSLFSYWGESKGTYQQTSFEFNETKSLVTVRMTNYRSEELNGVKILVPTSLDTTNIESSLPVAIDIATSEFTERKQKAITVSLIPAQTTVSLLIPVSLKEKCCQLLNGGELGLKEVDSSAARNVLLSSIYEGIKIAFIYSVIFWIFTAIYMNRLEEEKRQRNVVLKEVKDEREEILKKIKDERDEDLAYAKRTTDSLKEDAEQNKKETEELQKSLTEARRLIGRFKASTLKRLDDHSKEITFWRNTIRKVLYQENMKGSVAEDLIETVTKELKTFSTQKDVSIEFEAIEAMAELYLQDERKRLNGDETK